MTKPQPFQPKNEQQDKSSLEQTSLKLKESHLLLTD